jgi:hypothetical protein
VLNPAHFEEDRELVHAGFGEDGPLNIDVGYVHSVAPWVVGTRVSLPVVPDGTNFELVGLAERGFVSRTGFGIATRFELALRNAHTVFVNSTDAGIHLGIRGGYFGRRASLAGELAWERSLLVYLLLTDRYRQEAFANARSGFYGSGGGFFRLGLAGGVRILVDTEVTLRTGIVRSEGMATVDMLPLYAELGLNHAF